MRRLWIPLVLLVAACSPQEQPFNPAPAGGQRLEKNVFYASDMTMLPYRAWLPRSRPEAVVIALHGFNDYSNAFSEVGAYFAQRGIAVYAYDQRGFGATPHRGIWGNRANYVQDLRQFAQLVQDRHPKLPLYMLGESMGSAVVINALAGGDIRAAGVVMVAPAIWGGDAMPLLFRGTLWASAHIAPSWQMTGSDLNILATDNIPLLRRMSEDPLIIKATRVDAIYGLVQMMDAAYEAIPEIRLPVLVLYGARDQVIPPYAIETGLARFSMPVTFAYYPEGYHMLLRDLKGARVMDDVIAWLRDPKNPLPSGHSSVIDPQSAKNVLP